MTTFSLPLNITDPAQKILMDAVNFENQASFDYTDFTFGAPEAATLVNTEVNTKITLTPNVGTLYYNPKVFYYERMDIGNIYNTNKIYLASNGRNFVSELLPEINAFYGINLTIDDIIEQALPMEDPANPDAILNVALQVSATSILFQGVANLSLNEPAPVIDKDNYDRRTYVLVDNEVTTIYNNKIVAYNTNYEIDPNFTVLSNCTAILKFNASRIIALANGNIAIRGVFKFTSGISGADVAYDVTNITLGPNGNLMEVGTATSFGPAAIVNWFGYRTDPYRYVIDATNVINTNPATRLYRYDVTGVLDTAWSATGITYVPAAVTTDKLGRVYTFSSPYNTGGWKVRGDRLNVDGTLDPTFTSVIFSITGSGQPFPVVQIKTNKFNELFVVLKPAGDVSSITAAPVVNGVPVIPGGTTQVYAYSPVFKFKENGDWDTSYVNSHKNLAPTAIYDNASTTLVVHDRVLSVEGNNVNFLTNIRNPITGFLYRTPMSFDKFGSPVRLSGNDYEMQIRWDSAKNIVGLMNGKVIVFGTALLRNPAGGWNVSTGVAAVYYQNGVSMQIIHNATRAVAGAVLQVRDVVTVETEY